MYDEDPDGNWVEPCSRESAGVSGCSCVVRCEVISVITIAKASLNLYSLLMCWF